MKVHLIAIGGSAMHNIALALNNNGHEVSGSDDQIFEPSKSRLSANNLLPEKEGWDESRIDDSIDAIILGMHAKADNPELVKAQNIGVPIFSYPEFIYEQSKDKKRVVIGGSHGKTTTTSMILHALKTLEWEFDYLVGAQLKGFETMVKLSDAPVIIIEGDEYLSSPIDRRPKFHLYHHHVGLITGIAWDHINVFPTFENYKEQFEKFIDLTERKGAIIYFNEDKHTIDLIENQNNDIRLLPYTSPKFEIKGNGSEVQFNGQKYDLSIFGKHNLENMEGARLVCQELGISTEDFLGALESFEGADKRLQLLESNGETRIYKDFAHSPSKLKATIDAVKLQFPLNKLIACVELHTFSSLTKSFLSEYKSSMNSADQAFVYFNPATILHKKLEPISKEDVYRAFDRSDLLIYNDSDVLVSDLKELNIDNSTVLIMTSGNFDGVELEKLSKELIDN